MQGVLINLRDIHLVLNDSQSTQPPTKIRVPAFIEVADETSLGRPTTLNVTSKCRPIIRSGLHFIHWLCECRPLCQSPLIRYFRGKFESLRGRSEGIKTIKFRFRITCTVVRRSIRQAVCRHDPVEATTPDPVIDIPVLLIEIYKLDSGTGRNQKALRRLGDITPMMEPVGFHIWRELLLHLAGPRIPPGVDATMAAACQRRRPYETSYNQEILRRLISGRIMSSLPQPFPGLKVIALHLVVSASVKNHILVEDQTRSKVERYQGSPSRLLASPELLTGPAVEAGHIFPVVIHENVPCH